MIPARFGLLLCALVLTACQATQSGRAAYEAPLRQGGVMEAEQKTATAVSTANLVSIDDAGITHSEHSYRVADLNAGQRPSDETLEAGLWLAFDKMEASTRTSGNRLNDPELEAYLSNVVCRMTADHCPHIRVYAMRIPAFNASMAGNGMMHVWTGLLLRVRNEAQLAAILGHETGHYLRRHSMQRLQSTIDTSNFMVFFSIALAGAGGGAFGDLATLIAAGGLSAFSRDNEREADGYGLLLMHRGGYDPREAAKTWANLMRERDANPEKGGRDAFFATHPATEERNEVLTELGAAVAEKSDQLDLGRERFLEIILPRRGVWLRDELNQRNFEATNELLDIMLTDDPNPAELLYFKGETHRLRNAEGDGELALDWYQKALSAQGQPPADIHRSQGLVRNRNGDTQGAQESFRAYLRAKPDASDKLIIEDMIKRLATS